MERRGQFIVFEGIDGSGKSTHVRLLCDELKRRGLDVLQTGEPSRGRIGEFITETVEHGAKRHWVEVEALLFAADRFEHTKGLIEPALEKGVTVVSDRYLHSSLAYQGAGGISLDWIRELNRFALKPSLSIFLDVSLDAVFQRMSGRRKTVFEERNFLQRVKELYLGFAEIGELVKIDAERPIEDVHRDVLLHVERVLKGSRL